jgi:hypothetical protein
MTSIATVPAKARFGSSASGNLTLRVATNVAEIENLRQIWELWQEHPNSVIDNYLSEFSPDNGHSPYVMVVYRDARPDCLLIGKQLPRGVTSAVSSLLQPARRTLYFVQGGLLGSPSAENCEFLIRRIVARLRRGEADAAEFYALRVDSSLYRAALRVPDLFSRDHFPLPLTHRYLLLPDSFENFLAGLPAKERQNIAYRQKRLLTKFSRNVHVRRFTGEDAVDDLISDIEEIARKTYQRSLGRGFTRASHAFLRAQARNGSLRGYLLYIEERPAAYLVASWHHGILYGTFVGYDPQYAQFAPGKFLLMRSIEDCLRASSAQRTILLDPGTGDEPYKHIFTNVELQEAHVTIHPPTFSGFLCNLARTSRYSAALCARALLCKAHLLSVTRKIRRRRALRKWRARPVAPSSRVTHDRVD